MYVRKNNLAFIVADRDIYIDSNGIKYPRNYPKDEISELEKVTETAPPQNKIIEGFFIDEDYIQMWNFRDKNTDELKAELINQAQMLLYKSDMVAIRCVKAGLEFPTIWQNYVATLRVIVNGEDLAIPEMPEYPQGS